MSEEFNGDKSQSLQKAGLFRRFIRKIVADARDRNCKNAGLFFQSILRNRSLSLHEGISFIGAFLTYSLVNDI